MTDDPLTPRGGYTQQPSVSMRSWHSRGYADGNAGRTSHPPDDQEARAAYLSSWRRGREAWELRRKT